MIVIRNASGEIVKPRTNGTVYTTNIGLNIHPKFQEVLDVANTNGFTTPSINGLRAGSRLAKNLDENGFFENSTLIYVNTWNNLSLENLSKICWNRHVISTYNGGYTYESFGVRGNKTNAFHDYNFNPSVENHPNFQLNDACDVYFRSRAKSAGATNYLEGCVGNGANRMRAECADSVVINNFLNNGTSSPTLIDSFVTPERAQQFGGSATGMMYKKRISSSQIWLGDKFGEGAMNRNSSVMPNFATCGMRQQNSYYDHTQGFVWKGKGSFMTNAKFLQLRSFINQYLSDLNLSQNA
jgi:hypothetical protein